MCVLRDLTSWDNAPVMTLYRALYRPQQVCGVTALTGGARGEEVLCGSGAWGAIDATTTRCTGAYRKASGFVSL